VSTRTPTAQGEIPRALCCVAFRLLLLQGGSNYKFRHPPFPFPIFFVPPFPCRIIKKSTTAFYYITPCISCQADFSKIFYFFQGVGEMGGGKLKIQRREMREWRGEIVRSDACATGEMAGQASAPVRSCGPHPIHKKGPSFLLEPLSIQLKPSRPLSAGTHFGGFQAFSALCRLKFDSLPFLEGTESLTLNVGIMDKKVLTAFIRDNKPVPFVFAEPLDTARSQITFLLTALLLRRSSMELPFW